MNRVTRTRAVEAEEPELPEAEDVEAEEPAYERDEGESAQEAQDRIEEKYRARATSPLRAIRAFCVLCMGAQPKEVARCTATRCILFKFRDGKNPYQRHKDKDAEE